MPGRKPWVQVAPLLVDVAHPIFELPPCESGKRPTWKAETMVEPKEKVSGSTSVWCWLVLLVYGSLLIWTVGTLAKARLVEARVNKIVSVKATMARVRHLNREIASMLLPP